MMQYDPVLCRTMTNNCTLLHTMLYKLKDNYKNMIYNDT